MMNCEGALGGVQGRDADAPVASSGDARIDAACAAEAIDPRWVADELEQMSAKWAERTREREILRSASNLIRSLQRQERGAREDNARNAMAVSMLRDRARLALLALNA